MVTAQDVKALREKTGAGMMDCKKALTEVNGDIEKAIDWLREKGMAKVAKKAGRIAAEGLTKVATDGNIGVIFEVNSETDFVAKNDLFLNLLEAIKDVLLNNKPADLEAALALDVNGQSLSTFVDEAASKIGEKITLRRLSVIEKTDADAFGCYMHMGGTISALVVLKGTNDEAVAKDIAMQIASMSPVYVTMADVPSAEMEREKAVQQEIMKQDEKMASKPENVLAGILQGKLSKHFKDQCLLEQEFFKDGNLKIAQVLKQANATVESFVRFQVGEGIEKKEENFAEEVMNQLK